jgi:ATP-dependent Clp protease adaptor protein ClpS
MADTELAEEIEAKIGVSETNNLVIYNDDYNTFDHVINSLIKVCKHEPVQAEQCTWIIHYNGKCAVKEGDMTILKPMREALSERGLDAKIH